MPARRHPYRSPAPRDEGPRPLRERADLSVPIMTLAAGVLGLVVAAGGSDRIFEAGAGTMMTIFGTGAIMSELRALRGR